MTMVERVLEQVENVIRDKDEVVEKVLMAMLAGGNVLMEDVPGTGKTTLALSFARSLGLDSKRIQFTSDTLPSDVIGFSVYDSRAGELSYKPGAVMTNILLADEINRTSAKTQSALLEAMEEHKVTIDGVTHELPVPFIVLATQNPAGSAGTQMLPNSQLDRFMVRLTMGYPGEQGQIEIMKQRHGANPVDDIEPVSSPEEFNAVVKEVSLIHIADSVYAYISRLATATREHEFVDLGMSPRGALALCRMSQAGAYVRGRDYVTPDDVYSVFSDVCDHRLILNARARLNELTAHDISTKILEEVQAPSVSTEKPLSETAR